MHRHIRYILILEIDIKDVDRQCGKPKHFGRIGYRNFQHLWRAAVLNGS